jgi:hypothetical protein
MLPQVDDARTVSDIKALYEMLRDGWRRFRIQQIRNYEMVAGIQISDEKRKQLEDANRPALVYNLLTNKITTIAGLLETNKTFLKAISMQEGDEKSSEMHSMLVSDYALKQCDGYREISKAALDAAIAKIGWTNNYWTDKHHPEGSWVTEAFDPLMIMFDLDARKQDQKDWKYYEVSAWYTCDEIIQVYAKYLTEDDIAELRKLDEVLNGFNRNKKKPTGWVDRIVNGVGGIISYVTGSTPEGSSVGHIDDYVDTRAGRYRVIEHHDKRYNQRMMLHCPATGEKKLPPSRHDEESGTQFKNRLIIEEIPKLTQENGQQWFVDAFQAEELWITAVVPGLLPDKPLMEVPYPIQNRGFQHKPIFCYDFHPDITKTQSIIDVLIDPQNSFNQRRMTTLEMLMNAVNPDWMMPNQMIANAVDAATWKSKERGKVRTFDPMLGQKPEPIHPLGEALTGLKWFAEEDREISEVLTNVTPNTQGKSENSSESGILYAQRVQQSMTALAYYFGNVTASMKEIFRYCDASLQYYMTMPRKIRLLSKSNDPQWLAVNWPTVDGVHNDISQGEFDWIADTTKVGETTRQMKFAEMLEITKVIASIDPVYCRPDLIVKLWDSPVAEEWAKSAAQLFAAKMAIMGAQVAQAQQMQQMQQQQQQLQLQSGQIQQGTQTAGMISAMEQAAGAGDMPSVPGAGADRKYLPAQGG